MNEKENQEIKAIDAMIDSMNEKHRSKIEKLKREYNLITQVNNAIEKAMYKN